MNIKDIAKRLREADEQIRQAQLNKKLTLIEIGHMIRRARIENRMQLTTFAKKIGRSQTFGCFLEKGTAKITPALLKRIGEVLR